MSDGNHIDLPELKTEPIKPNDDNAHADDPNKKGQAGETKVSLESLTPGASDKPKRTAEEVAQDQEDAWVNNILSGKASIKALEENESLKTWLLPRVQGRLTKLSGEEKVDPAKKDEMDFSTIEAYEVHKQHKKNLELLKTLPTKLHNELVTEAKSLVELGADPAKTLDKILKDNKDKLSAESLEKTRKRELQQLPAVNTGGGGARTTYKMEELAMLPQEEFSRIKDLADEGKVEIIN